MVDWGNIKPEDLEYADRAFKHGIKKEEYEELFRNPFYKRKIKNKGEVRYLIVGKVHGKYIMAIMAPSSGRLRIFSGREPSEEYKELYRKK